MPVPTADRIAATGTVAATPAAVFRIVTDPVMHVEIDGSGMLEAAPGTKRVEKVGDTFVMDMDRESLGDQPMGKYKSVNTVTRIVPDELLEWNVGLPGDGPFGHVYGWEITALGPNETTVTNYCSWPDIPEYARPHFPIVPLSMLEQSVRNLAALVDREAEGAG
jgi:Polyketide cyclase / dehydrase and lipid transport